MKQIAGDFPATVLATYVAQYRTVVALLAAQLLLALYAGHLLGSDVPTVGIWSDIQRTIPYAVYAVLAYRLLYLSYIEPVPNRIARLLQDTRSFFSDRARLVEGVATISLLMIGMACFAQSKRLVTALQPFGWDETIADLDRMLFLGQDPWRVAHDLIGWNWLLSLLTMAYVLWFTVLFSALLIAAFATSNRQARMQFLIAHAMTWLVVGTLMAIALSSAGPVYFHELGLGDNYLPLIDRLNDHTNHVTYSVRPLQDQLWALYSGPENFSVISAMPSMHVASIVVVALYGFTASRLLGWLLSALAGLIFLGSFMLGWHYFLDGVVSALVVAVIWRVSGWLSKRAVPAA